MAGEERKLEKLKEAYKNYFKHYSIQTALGLVWLTAAIIGKFDIQVSILTLFFGISMLKPLVYLLTRIIGFRKIHKDENLIHMIRVITIGMLVGVIAVFFPFVTNINYFFPAFTIVIGLIFGSISYTGRFLHYGIIALMLITGSVYLGYLFNDDFYYSGIFSGLFLIGFGVLNGLAGERARIVFIKRKSAFRNWKASLVEQIENVSKTPQVNKQIQSTSVLEKQKV